MNRYKFRGQTIGGEWVTGNLSILKKDFSTVRKGYYISNSAGAPFAFMVRPESVGQFTGIHDKNGVEIYEGKDSIELHLIGLGKDLVDVVMKDGQWSIYTESQGYAPLFDMLNNSSAELTIHTQEKGQGG